METIKTSGLHAVKAGIESDAPLVFLHGFGTGAFVWSPMQSGFQSENGSLAYDLPGHGQSVNADGIGSAGHMAKAICADLIERNISRAHLVGHSTGGTVATKIALHNPSLVASMTLLAPGAFGPEVNHRLLTRFAQATGHDVLLAALENMFGWNNRVPEQMVSALADYRSVDGACDRLKSILGCILEERDGGIAQGMIGRRELAKLTMPVKVLWGTQDRVLPTRQAHRLPPLFAAHVFEDTGHMLIEERADETVHLIRQNIKAAGG